MLTPAAKGAWIEILTALHSSETRGELTMSVENWARIIGCLGEEAGRLLRELGRARVCDMVTQGNDDVTVVSRRMKRESHDWELLRNRVARHRERKAKGIVPDGVTDLVTDVKRSCNGNVTGKKLEARSQKHKKTENTADGRNGCAAAPATEAELVGVLAKDPAYQGIDVAHEVAKCRVWCEAKRKRFSKMRVINWLNRVDRPVDGGLLPGMNPFQRPAATAEEHAKGW